MTETDLKNDAAYLDDLAQLALALSLLDGEVKWSKADEPMSSSGGMWCEELIKKRAEAALPDDPIGKVGRELDRQEITRILRNVLVGGQASVARNLLFREAPTLPEDRRKNSQPNTNLHDMLRGALRHAVAIAVDDQNQRDYRAGAVYLYNELCGELVMAASCGFPFRQPSEWAASIQGKAPQALSPPPGGGAPETVTEKSSDKSQGRQIDLREGLWRLRYVKDTLQDRVGKTTISRHEWLREELRGDYRDPTVCRASSEKPGLEHMQCVKPIDADAPVLQKCADCKFWQDLDWPLDCNEDLIGVAYYQPGSGITGQLFHKEKGPNRERLFLSKEEMDPAGGQDTNFETNFLSQYRTVPRFHELAKARAHVDSVKPTAELQEPHPVDCLPLVHHLKDEALAKRTAVFGHRSQMAAGRQVQAGLYEVLQFPSSDFIGPFLGTVLRFDGEHLGILKVEKHKFRSVVSADKPYRLVEDDEARPDQPARDDDHVSPFLGWEAARFLLYAYCLSGCLYILKHYHNIDVSKGWTGHFLEGPDVENT